MDGSADMHDPITAEELLTRINGLLADKRPEGAVLKALEANHDGEWWHVVVQPDKLIDKKLYYYEDLAKVEGVLSREGLSVLLVPVRYEAQAA